MGYILIYIPLFNYMADEITTTTEPQETATVEKPKTYKRGE
jgi:hypothetical protein